MTKLEKQVVGFSVVMMIVSLTILVARPEIRHTAFETLFSAVSLVSGILVAIISGHTHFAKARRLEEARRKETLRELWAEIQELRTIRRTQDIEKGMLYLTRSLQNREETYAQLEGTTRLHMLAIYEAEKFV